MFADGGRPRQFQGAPAIRVLARRERRRCGTRVPIGCRPAVRCLRSAPSLGLALAPGRLRGRGRTAAPIRRPSTSRQSTHGQRLRPRSPSLAVVHAEASAGRDGRADRARRPVRADRVRRLRGRVRDGRRRLERGRRSPTTRRAPSSTAPGRPTASGSSTATRRAASTRTTRSSSPAPTARSAATSRTTRRTTGDPTGRPTGRRSRSTPIATAALLRGYLVDPDGSNLRRIDVDAWVEYPSFSPDGTQIAFMGHAGSRLRASSSRTSRRARSSSSPTRRATTAGRRGRRTARRSRSRRERDDCRFAPPDAECWRGDEPDDEHRDIWLIDADGSNLRRVSPETGQFVAWSPDGQYLLVSGHALYVVRPDGTGRLELRADGHRPAARRHPGLALSPAARRDRLAAVTPSSAIVRPSPAASASVHQAMAEVLLFHHAQGLTPGVRAFADELRAAGHTVHTPDLFDGRTFGVDRRGHGLHQGQRLRRACRERGVRTADDLPGRARLRRVLVRRDDRRRSSPRPGPAPAARCCSTRAIPISGEWAFGPWPDGVPVQIHGMDNDPIFVGEGDIDAAREIVEKVDDAELFLYPGDQHYFADSSLPSYDADATALLTRAGARVPGPRLTWRHRGPVEHAQRPQRVPAARLALAVVHLEVGLRPRGRSRAAIDRRHRACPRRASIASATRSSGVDARRRAGTPARAGRRRSTRSGTRTRARSGSITSPVDFRRNSRRSSMYSSPAAAGRGHLRRPADRPLVLEQALDDVDRRPERRHGRAVLDLAVPAAVGELLAEQPVDERRHVHAEVRRRSRRRCR